MLGGVSGLEQTCSVAPDTAEIPLSVSHSSVFVLPDKRTTSIPSLKVSQRSPQERICASICKNIQKNKPLQQNQDLDVFSSEISPNKLTENHQEATTTWMSLLVLNLQTVTVVTTVSDSKSDLI